MAELIDLVEDALSGDEGDITPNIQEELVQEEPDKKDAPPVAPKPVVKKVVAPRAPRAPPSMEKVIRMQPTTVEGWLVGRSKFPAEFSYTAEGDLHVPPIKAGDVARVIPLPRFQRATPEFTAEFYKTRAQQAKEQEELYVQSKRALKNTVLLYKNGEATVDEVLNANMAVANEEHKLNEILKLPRKTADTLKVGESSLTMNPYDKGKLADTVVYTTYTTFPAKSLWMTAPEPEVVGPQPLPIRQTESSNSNSNSNNTPPPAPKKKLTAQQLAIIRARMGKK